MVKVSIIVPVYNVEKYLKKCLDSLVNQTLKNIEIIIVNDGSPDNSQIIIDEYVKKYPKIIMSFIKENGGQGSARNLGLEYAKGEFISFVDSDDYIENDMIEKAYNEAVKSKSDIVVFGNKVVDENYNILDNSYKNNYENFNYMEIMIFNNVCVWNKVIRRSLLANSTIKFRSKVWYEDLDFSFKLMTLTEKIYFLNDNLYNYLLRQNSSMNNNNIKKNKDIILALDEMINYCNQNNIYEKYKSELEFLAIDHIYISSVVRVLLSKSDEKLKREIINSFINYVNYRFPSFMSNKYIYKLTRNRKIILYLVKYKQFWLIKFLFRMKEVVK